VSYRVRDQNPLTGGRCPLGKRIVYQRERVRGASGDVSVGDWVDRLLGGVGGEQVKRDDRAAEIPDAVSSHPVAEDLPAGIGGAAGRVQCMLTDLDDVRSGARPGGERGGGDGVPSDRRERRRLVGQVVEPALRRGRVGYLDAGGGHGPERAAVGGRRRIDLHLVVERRDELGAAGNALRECGWVLIEHDRRLAHAGLPRGQRGRVVLLLQALDRGKVGGILNERATQQPHRAAGSHDPRHAGEQRAAPSGRRERVRAGIGPG
jgi:hypothetical protein